MFWGLGFRVLGLRVLGLRGLGPGGLGLVFRDALTPLVVWGPTSLNGGARETFFCKFLHKEGTSGWTKTSTRHLDNTPRPLGQSHLGNNHQGHDSQFLPCAR